MKFSGNTTPGMRRTYKEGASVRVRLHGGVVVERVMVEKTVDTVYLCSPDCYARMQHGDPDARPVGFPH